MKLLHHGAGLDDTRRANDCEPEAAQGKQATVQNRLLGVWRRVGDAEQGEDGHEIEVADAADGLCAITVDGPAGDGAEDEVGDAERDEEDARLEAVEVEECLGVCGDCGVEGAKEEGLDEGDEEGGEEGGGAEAIEDRDAAKEGGLGFWVGDEVGIVGGFAADEGRVFVICGVGIGVRGFFVVGGGGGVVGACRGVLCVVARRDLFLNDEEPHEEVDGEKRNGDGRDGGDARLLVQQAADDGREELADGYEAEDGPDGLAEVLDADRVKAEGEADGPDKCRRGALRDARDCQHRDRGAAEEEDGRENERCQAAEEGELARRGLVGDVAGYWGEEDAGAGVGGQETRDVRLDLVFGEVDAVGEDEWEDGDDEAVEEEVGEEANALDKAY